MEATEVKSGLIFSFSQSGQVMSAARIQAPSGQNPSGQNPSGQVQSGQIGRLPALPEYVDLTDEPDTDVEEDEVKIVKEEPKDEELKDELVSQYNDKGWAIASAQCFICGKPYTEMSQNNVTLIHGCKHLVKGTALTRLCRFVSFVL